MVSLGNAISAVNTASIGGLAINQMALQARLDALGEDLPGGAGRPTHIRAGALPGGDGSASKPYASIDEAATAMNEKSAALAAVTGTQPEIAAAMAPAVVFIDAGAYTQSVPFKVPAIVVPSPGVALSTTLKWAPPAHNSASVNVPFSAGVIIDQENGADPILLVGLDFVTVAATLGSWQSSIVLQGPTARTLATGNITTTGPDTVAILADQCTVGDIASDAGNLIATRCTVGEVSLTSGRATLDECFMQRDITTAGFTPGLNARACEFTSPTITSDIRIDGCRFTGSTAIVGNGHMFDCDINGGIASWTGDAEVDTTSFSGLVDAGATPSGTTTLFGVTGGSVAAGASPQVVTFGVTFPTAPRGVTVTPQAAAVDATTFCGITAVSTTTVTVAHGGVGAGAPTFLHWMAVL